MRSIKSEGVVPLKKGWGGQRNQEVWQRIQEGYEKSRGECKVNKEEYLLELSMELIRLMLGTRLEKMQLSLQGGLRPLAKPQWRSLFWGSSEGCTKDAIA